MTLSRKETKHLRSLGIKKPSRNKGEPVTIAWKPLLIGLAIGLIIFIIMIWGFK